MTIATEDKPLQTLRQEVIDQLVLNYAHEQLSRAAFEPRLDDAYDAESQTALSALVADLDSYTDSTYDKYRDHLLYANEEERQDAKWCVNIFSGTHSDHEEIVPATLKLVSIFGGANLDYSLSRFSAPRTQIKVMCLFGGVEIHIPEGVKIHTHVIPLFGGCHNRGEPVNDPDAPVVYVSGLALFGGITVGVKRTFRERIQDFADQFRHMFS